MSLPRRVRPIVSSLAASLGAKVKRELQAVAIRCILDVGNLRYRWRDREDFLQMLSSTSDPEHARRPRLPQHVDASYTYFI